MSESDHLLQLIVIEVKASLAQLHMTWVTTDSDVSGCACHPSICGCCGGSGRGQHLQLRHGLCQLTLEPLRVSISLLRCRSVCCSLPGMLQLSLQALSLSLAGCLNGCRSSSKISLLLVSLLQPLPQLADLVLGSPELCQRVGPGGLLPEAVKLCHGCVCLLHSCSQLQVELCQLWARL